MTERVDVPNDDVVLALSETRVSRVRAEYTAIAFGVGVAAPRLSWIIETEDPGWHSDRYELELMRGDGAGPGDGVVQRVVRESAEQVFVPWPFDPLASRARVQVRVRVASGEQWTEFSDPVPIETGLLESTDWSARFVSPASLGGLDDGAPIIFTSTHLNDTPIRARLYVTAHGLYEFRINGHKVGEDVLTPGWTAYEHRLRYQTYDVTSMLQAGEVRLSALLGNGWYRGQLVWPGNRSSYGDRLALLAQLELTFADGTTRIMATDETWRACSSSIEFDDLYDGQRRDLRVSDEPADHHSEPVEVLGAQSHELVAPRGPAMRVTERVPAVELLRSPSGTMIVDFGQNLVGWARVIVRDGRAGDAVVIRHAEVLEHGELGTRPLRSAKATCRYILSGKTDEVLVPSLTCNGFRFVEITGVPALELGDIEALVIGSDLERTGWLETSDSEVNRLHQNIVWSMRGNFLDIPTDCPQRDERLGWTGDAQVFSPTATYLFDTAGFLSNWLEDLAAEQKPDGGVPYVIPDVLRSEDSAAAAWSDAATIVPSVLYRSYADGAMLRRQYPSMRRWVDKITSVASPSGLWDTGFQFGDWLDPTAPPEDAGDVQADKYVVATAHYARSASLVSEAAATLGYDDEAAEYAALAQRVTDAFIQKYVSPDGIVQSDCQTVYALALCWNLISDADVRDLAAERLAVLVREAGFRVSTGFVGTPLILDALCSTGHPDLAFRMLRERECPSWLYAVTMGATTVWERWDSMLPDGSINPGSMTSFNHYAYGAVADWMHRTIGGIAPIEPGYRRVRICAMLSGPITQSSARYDSVFGTLQTRWERSGDSFDLRVTLPYGVTGEVWLPGDTQPREIGHGIHELRGRLS